MALPTYEELIAAIDAHIANGGEVRPQMWGFDLFKHCSEDTIQLEREDTIKLNNKCGCALAIYAQGKQIDQTACNRSHAIQLALNLSDDEIQSFVGGFDKCADFTPLSKEAYELGEKVRQYVIINRYAE